MGEIKNYLPRRSRQPGYIKRYYISRRLFNITLAELRRRGRKKHEGLVFWSGSVTQNYSEAYITACIIPRRGNWGGGVQLGPKDILKLTEALIRRDLLLLAQIHSHPGDFGHSRGDEEKAASYRIGYISIIIPNYCQSEFNDLSRCYLYEYAGNLKWRLLPRKEAAERFIIEDDVVKV